MNMPNLRNRSVYVTNAVYRALEVQSRALGLDCLDALADVWLSERIAAEPLLMERQKRFAQKMKELDSEMDALAGNQLP
jgi:hypothetical protein